VATLRELVARQRAADHAEEVAELAEQFHISLVELAANPVLAQYSKLVHHLLRGHVRGSVVAAGSDRPALADVSPDPHSQLVDLLAAGAAHAATEHWRKHLTTIEERLAQLLDLNAALAAPAQ
jgi:DNA-binding FadR family transcriptional regulator